MGKTKKSKRAPRAGFARSRFRDVTSRKAAEDALRESERKYRNLSQEFQALLDAIPDNLTLQGPDLRIIWANQGAAVGLGKSVPELEGRHCFSLWHQSSVPCISCPVQESFRTGTACTRQVTTPDGQVWELRSVPITDEFGVVTKVVEVGRNITENVRLEAQLLQAQKMESIGRLAGGVAHDFNNILSAIMGFGNLLELKMADDDPNRVYLNNILLSAEKAAGLTQSLLAFSRQQVIKPALLDINEIIRHVEKLLVRIIGEDIRFQTDLLPSKLVVMADPLQMEQVLMNLATNARDAMPSGGQLVIATDVVLFDEDYIKIHGYGKPGKYALISVTDTGMGVDEEIQSRLFEPFFTTKEVGKGTGLGLAIVYGIVKQHEGYINLYSEIGTGTIFKIYLPVTETTGMPKEEIPGERPMSGFRGSETILLVEDDSGVRKAIRTMLEEVGYTVIEAVDGQDAVQKFRLYHHIVDLLLLDVIMPGKNGGEVYAETRRIKPSLRVLFTSGYPADIIKAHVAPEEELHFLSKPVPPQALLRKIREIIGK
ncbi:MAG TPA: ATP-binding protein [Thermodesulfovibrionales bacterium]|nr:ATP-binding protein [Thermodesulfovibrionales bacterium]